MTEQPGSAGFNQTIVPQPSGNWAGSCVTWQQYRFGALCCNSTYNSGYNGTPVTPGFFTLGQGMMHPTPEQLRGHFSPRAKRTIVPLRERYPIGALPGGDSGG